MTIFIKRGQISIEIMYSVAVLLVIFLMLSSAAFDRKIQVERTRETVEKRSDCVMISNSLSRVASLGEGYSSTFKTIYNFDVFDTGLIVVSDVSTDNEEKEIEIICSFSGVLAEASFPDKFGAFKVENIGGLLNLTEI